MNCLFFFALRVPCKLVNQVPMAGTAPLACSIWPLSHLKPMACAAHCALSTHLSANVLIRCLMPYLSHLTVLMLLLPSAPLISAFPFPSSPAGTSASVYPLMASCRVWGC